MKKTIAILLAMMTVFVLFASCGKQKTDAAKDPNAVLTDSDVPLDVGAELDDMEESEVTPEEA